MMRILWIRFVSFQSNVLKRSSKESRTHPLPMTPTLMTRLESELKGSHEGDWWVDEWDDGDMRNVVQEGGWRSRVWWLKIEVWMSDEANRVRKCLAWILFQDPARLLFFFLKKKKSVKQLWKVRLESTSNEFGAGERMKTRVRVVRRLKDV